MNFRNDLPYLIISCISFQQFDHGGTIKEIVPAAWNLKPGDHLYWECAQFEGIAKVIENNQEGECIIKKIS